ncbi:MAG: GIY-YIG nuclease family protein [Candidatus Brocadiaceae bacterium]|nr:GIY-YIG nuclease family protein [Candidatus Brocadiaceae bacterium]
MYNRQNQMCQKYWVYVIQSERDSWTYTGHTNNVKRRLHDHNRGKMKSTRYRGPFKTTYTEEFSNRSDAMKREKFLKSGKGRQIREELVKKILEK